MSAGTGSQLELSSGRRIGCALFDCQHQKVIGYSIHSRFLTLSASAPPTPLELIQEQPEVDRLTLPTGTTVFRAGEPVQFIHVIERGWVELSSGPLNRIRFGSGELFFYEDLVDGTDCHLSLIHI